MSGGSSKQEQSNKVDPALMALYNKNYQQAQDIANTPFQAYTGERVAGFNPTQVEAQGYLTNIARNRTGADTLAQAKGGISELTGYTAPVIGQPNIVSATPVTAGTLRDTDLTAYMNPFTQNVVDTSLADLSRARDVQRVADNQAATASKAFGGSRQGVADSLTNDAYLRNVSSTSANLRSAAFDKAVASATADLDRILNAGQFNSSQAYDAQKYNSSMAFDVARTNAANDMAGANFRLNAGNALAGLSNQELQQELSRAGALSMVGDAQQQNSQARNDAAWEEFMRMLQYPAQQQAIRSQALGMIPQQTTSTSTSSSAMGVGSILGAAGSVASAAATF